MRDISFDIETLSTRPDAAILSIGAAAFDRATGAIGRTMYVEVKIDDAVDNGHVDGSTLTWWVSQSDAARALFSRPNKVSLATAMRLVTEFVVREVEDTGEVSPWGNGSTFDITILESAYRRVGLPVPWKFWNVRDMRTIVDAAFEATGFDRGSIPFEGVPHHALYDAVHQAKVIATSWNAVTTERLTPAATEDMV